MGPARPDNPDLHAGKQGGAVCPAARVFVSRGIKQGCSGLHFKNQQDFIA
ncbi:hypothetical protein HMPREF3213_03344 [Heyndrickxia coagulans]|uniref:Uncharacterized protein n=1 Tax=Heyndrickxia coagulans TaxID=1398 RepID=A0A133KCH9_HEYCO|nr:hypothetical protein HMPREF3213_03344 [Heyndrickxia coagulans]KYC69587.1 hypothetical protein B4099_0216 [Heyndrickxia coagulans]